jgi:nitrite reductase/ring-hydroxylating ferredoxin subunit
MTHSQQIPPHDEQDHPSTAPGVARRVSRRTMLRGATLGGVGLPLLAACGSDGSAGDSGDSEPGNEPGNKPGNKPGNEPDSSSGGSGATVATAEVPVGGGTILNDAKLVVTQPTKGEYKAFSATCTHQGCLVGKVTGGEIVCPCHGSHFSISDGSAVVGPATSPLAARKVTVKGTRITVN